jgi:NADH-quinone oxidoreductase subunit F
MMGSGGMIVMDERTCMPDVARYYINFLSRESCGKCTPCREGLRHILNILNRICTGRGEEGDLSLLESMSEMLTETSLCGLGKSAANPVITTMKFFADEYKEHIFEKRCRAGVCMMETV